MSLLGIISRLTSDLPQLKELGNSASNAQEPRFAARRGARPVYLASLWSQRQVPMLVLTPRPEDSRTLHDQLLTYLGDSAPVYLLPEPEVLPFERLAVDARTVNQRLVALAALATAGEAGQALPLVVASVSAALRLTLPPDVVAGGSGSATSAPSVAASSASSSSARS